MTILKRSLGDVLLQVMAKSLMKETSNIADLREKTGHDG